MTTHQFRPSVRLCTIQTTAILAAIAPILLAADWPQWRGPNFNGSAPEADPPTTWSESDHVKWRLSIPGAGTSSPIVAGGKIFLTTAIPVGKSGSESEKSAAPAPTVGAPSFDRTPPAGERRRGGETGGSGDGQGRRGGGRGGFGGGAAPTAPYQFVLLCVDLASGKLLWQKTLREQVPHEGHHHDHGFASPSVVTDGQHAYAFFGSRGIYCADFQGNVQWEKDLGDMQTRNSFGEGASPALHGDVLVINWDHEGEDFIVALDKKSGDERWRQKRDEPTSWTTPLVVTHQGKPQVVVNGTNRIRSYDLATGQQIWECGGMTANVIPTPVTADGVLYITSGFRGAAFRAIKLGNTGDLTDSDSVLWKHDERTPYVPSPLFTNGRLYFFAGNNPLLTCLEAKTGQVHFQAERIDGPTGIYASPVAGGGRIYLAGRDGTTVVIKDAPKLEVLATNRLDDQFDASPALVGKSLLLRGHKFLYCLE